MALRSNRIVQVRKNAYGLCQLDGSPREGDHCVPRAIAHVDDMVSEYIPRDHALGGGGTIWQAREWDA